MQKVLSLLALAFLVACMASCSGATGSTDTHGYKLLVSQLSDSLVISGYDSLSDYQSSDSTYKYSGFYSPNSNRLSDDVNYEKVYLSCAEGGAARFKFKYVGDTIVNDFVMEGENLMLSVDNSRFRIPSSDSMVTLMCNKGNSDAFANAYFVSQYKGHSNYDTIAMLRVLVDSIIHLQETLYDHSASGNMCSQYFSNNDLLAPFRQAQIEAVTNCKESSHQLLLVRYDYAASDRVVAYPYLRNEVSAGIQGDIYDSVEVDMKASFVKSAAPWNHNDTAVYNDLLNELSEIATKKDRELFLYENDTAKRTVRCVTYSGYDYAIDIYHDSDGGVSFSDKDSTSTTDSEYSIKTLYWYIGSDGYYQALDTTTYSYKTKCSQWDTVKEPAPYNRDSLLEAYESDSAEYSNVQAAQRKFMDSIDAVPSYYISVYGDKYADAGLAKSGLMAIYGSCNRRDVGSVDYVDAVTGDSFKISVDYAGTDSLSGKFWHVKGTLPSAVSMTNAANVKLLFSSSIYPAYPASSDGLTVEGMGVSNLLPSALYSTYPVARLVSHEGYHAIVSSSTDNIQDTYDTLDARMLMYGVMPNDQNCCITMTHLQWLNLRNSISIFR